MRLLETIYGKVTNPPPVWLMRQAGRYLPEYQKLRQTSPDFISHCLDSDKAAETTLQPIQRFDLDAAIIFSDILLIPWAMGQKVKFVDGTGPVLNRLAHPAELSPISATAIQKQLQSVADAIKKTRGKLGKDKALIGFCGGAWTVASYMLEGGSSRDFRQARAMLWQETKACRVMLNHLVDASVAFLAMQARAGADVLMVFDSWAGVVPSFLRREVVIEPMAGIIAGLRQAGITQPIIAFPKGLSDGFAEYVAISKCDVLAVDQTVDCAWLDSHLPREVPVQGNLDPMALLAGGAGLAEATQKIRLAFRHRPHIFNLGHGIDPKTPIPHVHELLGYIRS